MITFSFEGNNLSIQIDILIFKIFSHLFQVGDRYFTDVIYGNRNGFLTVFTEPLSFVGESYIVRKVRPMLYVSRTKFNNISNLENIGNKQFSYKDNTIDQA